MRILLTRCLGLAFAVAATLSMAGEVPKDQAELRLYAAMSGASASSFFDGYASEACEQGKGPGRLATFNFFSKSQQSELIAGGSPLFLLGVLHVDSGASGEQRVTNGCRSMRSFVPENGHAYEIRQDPADRNCPITVKDLTTGTEVKTEKVKPKGACREKK